MTFTHALRLTGLAALALLAACGGGGGGGGTPPTPTYTVTFVAGTGGTLTGSTTQTITSGGNATAVTAVPNSGYTFTNWTGTNFTTSTANPLTVSSVTQNLTITANFTFQPATSLAYTDPTTGTYQLKKNTTLSTSTHLVLDLVGPSATTGCGVTAVFTADTTRVSWVNVASTDTAGTYVQNGTAFTLGSGTQILRGKLASGTLSVIAAQKGVASPVALNAPLLRIALDLKAGTAPTGTATLTSDNTKAQVLNADGTTSTIAVTVGTLAAQ